MANANRVLGVFAKWPTPGQVKTRLAGGDTAFGAAVASAFLHDTLHRTSTIPARRFIAFAPPEAESDFRMLATCRFDLHAQAAGDLGARMAEFLAHHLAHGPTVIVGTDSPTLPIAYIEQAFDHLEGADIVLGPATDGGYYLIGCAARVPPVFTNMIWSSSRVLADTISSLDNTWRLAVLPPWYDVDTPESWDMLVGHVAALRRQGADVDLPATLKLLK